MSSPQEDALGQPYQAAESTSGARSGHDNLPLYQPPPPLTPRIQGQLPAPVVHQIMGQTGRLYHFASSSSGARSGYDNLPLFQPPAPLVPRVQGQTEEDGFRTTPQSRPRHLSDQEIAATLLRLPRSDGTLNIHNTPTSVKPREEETKGREKAQAPQDDPLSSSDQDDRHSIPRKRKHPSNQPTSAITSSDEDPPTKRKSARRVSSGVVYSPDKRGSGQYGSSGTVYSPAKRKPDQGANSGDEYLPDKRESGRGVRSRDEYVPYKQRSARLTSSRDGCLPGKRKSDRHASPGDEYVPDKRKSGRGASSEDEYLPDNQKSTRPRRSLISSIASIDELTPVRRKTISNTSAIANEEILSPKRLTAQPADSSEEEMPTERRPARPHGSSDTSILSKQPISDSSSPGTPLAATFEQRMLDSKQLRRSKSPRSRAKSLGSKIPVAMRASQASMPVATQEASGSAGVKRDSWAEGAPNAADGDQHTHASLPGATAKQPQRAVIYFTSDEE